MVISVVSCIAGLKGLAIVHQISLRDRGAAQGVPQTQDQDRQHRDWIQSGMRNSRRRIGRHRLHHTGLQGAFVAANVVTMLR
ncbi:MAG: hypothetical protein JHC40_02575 [Burkholderiales bacterium]|jgi:hypothetical protein|nr:hypothetical protein [Burkholderiales bacterium]